MHRGIETNDSETDLCIVGSGPAGLTIAREFANSGVRVLVVESGADRRTRLADELNAIESVGEPRVMDQELLRARVLGGSSELWAGRCAPLDAIDFAQREWVPLSGWPIGDAELAPFFGRAASVLQLGPALYDDRAWQYLNHHKLKREVSTAGLRNVFWQYSRAGNGIGSYLQFAQIFPWSTAANVRFLLATTATELRTTDSGTRLSGLEVIDGHGKVQTIRAKAIVLAAGGLENPRLLLASRRDSADGVGNRHDVVGRYLMDHPRCRVLLLDPRHSGSVQTEFGHFWLRRSTRLFDYVRGLGLSSEAQQREGLLNCAAWLTMTPADDDAVSALKRLLRRTSTAPLHDARLVLSQRSEVIGAAHQRLVHRRSWTVRAAELQFDCMVEQRPDRDSRLTLAQTRDRHGVPLARINWRIHEDERTTVRRLSQLIAQEMTQRGLTGLRAPDWIRDSRNDRSSFVDMAHPMGTTRMSVKPSEGVVDRHCQVHDVQGLFVAGSSVFPTGGHVNPTMTIVALAIRLADHLKATFLR